MRYFLRVISLSFRYKWTIVASLINAVLVGILWGVSISAVYPFVEVIFQGATVEVWIDKQINDTGGQVEKLTLAITKLEQKVKVGKLSPDPLLVKELALKRDRLKANQGKLDRYRSLKSWVEGRLPKTPFGTLILVMGLLVVATIIKGICLVLNAVLVARVVNRTVMDLRRVFFRRALLMDQRRIEQLGTSSLMTNFSHNVNMIGGGLQAVYGKSIREPLKMIACFVGAAIVSWRLLLLCMLVAPLGILCIHGLAKQMKKAAHKEMGGWAVVIQTLMEVFGGMRVVRIFGRERKERHRFREDTRTLYRMSMRMATYDSLTSPITELAGILVFVIAVLAGAHLVLNQETHLLGIRISDLPLSSSALFVFYAMLAGISDPARKMSSIYNQLVRATTASQGLFATFEDEPKVIAVEPRQPVPCHCKSIRLNDVCFGYGPLKRVVNNVTLDIPFGQSIAILGENGCGKSTLIGLLARFYDPWEGDIYLDNTNLRNVSPRKLREQIALVSQDPLLFRGTVRDNIAYGKPFASDEQIMAAAKTAHVDRFLDQLPKGIETQVGDQGKFLSGGQRQRVALARAVLANPRILILDEATSQLDNEAERDVRESLRSFLGNCTTIMITHHQAMVKLADRVVVMDRGRIVQDLPAQEYLDRYRKPLARDRDAA